MKKGFTLFDLLAVVLVVATLAALLVPAISQSVDESFKMQCANNLRQVGLSLLLYGQDWDGWTPPWDPTERVELAVWPHVYVQYQYGGYDVFENKGHQGRVTNVYLNSELSVHECPEDAGFRFMGSCPCNAILTAGGRSKPYYISVGTSYAYNAWFHNAIGGGTSFSVWKPVKLSRVVNPSKCILVAEAGMQEAYAWMLGYDVEGREGRAQEYAWSNFRHAPTWDRDIRIPWSWHDKERSMNNTFFVDGHCDYVRTKAGELPKGADEVKGVRGICPCEQVYSVDWGDHTWGWVHR